MLTGSATYAGTDARVYLKMFGVKGTTREVELSIDGYDCFEKGQTDKFTVWLGIPYGYTDINDITIIVDQG